MHRQTLWEELPSTELAWHKSFVCVRAEGHIVILINVHLTTTGPTATQDAIKIRGWAGQRSTLMLRFERLALLPEFLTLRQMDTQRVGAVLSAADVATERRRASTHAPCWEWNIHVWISIRCATPPRVSTWFLVLRSMRLRFGWPSGRHLFRALRKPSRRQ